MNIILRTTFLLSILCIVNNKVNAQDFFVYDKEIAINNNSLEKCQNHCPSIEYKLIATNQPWLDQIVNTNVINSLDINQTGEKKPQQQNTNLADQDYIRKINSLISSIVADNNKLIKERGKQFDNVAFISVSSVPSYIGHKKDLELFAIDSYNYTGGAHGIGTKQYLVFDTANKRQLKLSDVVLNGRKVQLQESLQAQFINYLKKNNIPPKEHLESWPFTVTDNFIFTDTGIKFLYQPYEITPYAMGMPELTLTYQQLAPLIKPQYLP